MTEANKGETLPEEIDGARVLHFLKIDRTVRPTGNTRHIVGGMIMGPAYGLAICKYQDEIGYYLFGCDENWNSITDTYHDTIEDAIRQGEFEYEGTKEKWIAK